jgi:hypothetical protein
VSDSLPFPQPVFSPSPLLSQTWRGKGEQE